MKKNINLGIVLPMGQNKKRLKEAGQWDLWKQELKELKKNFNQVELFEYQYSDWRRFIETILLPLDQKQRFKSCQIFKAVHLTGTIPCLTAKLFYGAPFVFSYGYRYDRFALIEKKPLQWLLAKLLTPIALKNAVITMIPTKILKKFVKQHGAQKIALIPNGVNTKAFSPSKLEDSKTRILNIGRLVPQKNQLTLIKAIANSKYRSRIKLTILGQGHLKQKLIFQAKQLKVNLKIIDSLPNQQLPKLFHQNDIFILPSIIEGHPKALLEAMSCGLPCIASDIPSIRETIHHGQNGLLFKPVTQTLSQNLDTLITDASLRSKLGQQAHQTITQKFDKEKLFKKEIALYENTLCS